MTSVTTGHGSARKHLPRGLAALLGLACGVGAFRWWQPGAQPALLLPAAVAIVAAAPAYAHAQGSGGPYMPPAQPGGPLKAAEKQQEEIKKDLAPAAKGGDLKAAKRLLEYLLYKHQFPRADAFKALADAGNEKVLEFLVTDGLFHAHPVVRSDVIDVLVASGYTKAVPSLVKLLSTEKELRQQLVIAIATLGGKEQASLLAKTAKAEKDPYARAEALEALGRISPEECLPLAKAASVDKEFEVRVGALRALQSVDPTAAFEGAMANLRERRVQTEKKQKKGAWQPVLYSIRVLLETREREKRAAEYREAIDILIALLEPKTGETGRMKHVVAEAIRSLSGKADLADDHAALVEWWAVVREKFVAKDLAPAPSSGGDPGKKPRKGKGGEASPAPEPAPEPAAVGTSVRFHGIPIWSDRVDFVIDSSGSMDTVIPVPPPSEEPGAAGSTERGKPKPATGGERPKKDLSREELVRAVRSLPEVVWFNVISYGSDVESWKPQLTPASKGAKADLEAWTAKLKLGRTNYFAALMLPLVDPNVDTVYFLTDGGGATDGRYTDHDRIIARILEVNKYTLVEYHCILFCSQDDQQNSTNRKWLEQVCTPSGGQLYLRPEYK